jgi:hypothetical protein
MVRPVSSNMEFPLIAVGLLALGVASAYLCHQVLEGIA